MYQQIYSPLAGSIGASAAAAALPLAVLFVLLGVFKVQARWAALCALVCSLAVAIFVYQMPVVQAGSTAALGASTGFFPIIWIGINAIWVFKLTQTSGHDVVLRNCLSQVSPDTRVQAVLIAFCFGGLLESLAGGGAPVAICAVMLIAVGLDPVKAADIEQSEVLRWMDRFAAEGVHGVTLCDTTGMAFPSQVGALTSAARAQFPGLELTLHFHNTRGMALANTLAALAAGVNRFDASLGGLGGCPYAPGATGNVCTEELVHMLELDGYNTGVDLAALLSASAALPRLIGHDVPSQLLKAGRRSDLHTMPCLSSDGLPEQRAFATGV
ncbi:hydroxymethylglutaryl-CoA lyase [Caballeronia hypogeia]|uniref:L-lactate permease n=1 Tax=Caballeronia hypogeia TaxID=1777140 RepID=A0A158DUZ6_9BURK|nr:L-lactate permease [Caballeronia hypogeia]SAK98016.1 hydroxymethylglutaryl-CoA lyase [Caballeronia hypogeia]